jgi:Co/Zn/Cd efflux system component
VVLMIVKTVRRLFIEKNIVNALFGWWWADLLVSLVIVYYGIREAIHALHESAESTQLTDALSRDI